MTRITLAIAAVLSLAFTPLAAQQTDCDGWMSSDWQTVMNFWRLAGSETVAKCLTSGADVNLSDDLRATPLHWVAYGNNNPNVLRALLTAGAELNARDDVGNTPLYYAAQSNKDVDVLLVLLNAGANVNTMSLTGHTPLHGAAEYNENSKIVITLLNAGADGTAVNEDGKTPFDLAQDNEALEGTDAYWALNDARFE